MRSTLFTTLLAVLMAPASLATPGDDFSQARKFYGSQIDDGDLFGRCIDTDGKVTAIGVHESSDPSAPGAVYVFRGCSGMTEEQILTASDGFAGDQFGYDVAVDGDTIVVGSPQRGGGASGLPGAAYVYRYDGLSWNEVQKVVAPSPQADSMFGAALDLDDDLLAIGAHDWNGTGVNERMEGKVYVYTWDGLEWTYLQDLWEPALSLNARFGYAVAVEGGRVVIGSPALRPQLNSPRWGAAYVWRYDSGRIWEEPFPRWASEPGKDDYRGRSVAVHGDTILVGADGDDDVDGGDPNVWRGAAYVYQWDGARWNETQKLVGNDTQNGDYFGGWQSVGVQWPVAVVGAWGHDSAATDAGALHVFRWDGNQFTETQKITANDAESEDVLYQLALAGGMLVASAVADDDRGTDAGAAYVFTAPAQDYGAGIAGSGGFTPRIDLSGDITPGGNATLEVRDFLGGTVSFVLVGAAPSEAPLLVDLSQPFRVLAMTLPGSGPGEGDADLGVTIPGDPALSCQTFYLQALAIDPGAASGMALSNGLIAFID